MNLTLKNMIKILNNLLDDVTFIEEKEKIDYLSYQEIDIQKGFSAYEAYQIMTSYQPQWMAILFRMRDFLTQFAGIKEIQGFSKVEKLELNVGEVIHFFTIMEKQDDKLTLVIKDSHLDVCLCFRIVTKENDHKQNKLYLITSVKNHNFLGRLYMLPVSFIHPYIVNRLFKNFN